jgi:hypothetical protein
VRPRVRLSLPPLSPAEALAFSRLLDRLDNALWRYYGQEMNRLLDPRSWKHESTGCDSESKQPAVKERGR